MGLVMKYFGVYNLITMFNLKLYDSGHTLIICLKFSLFIFRRLGCPYSWEAHWANRDHSVENLFSFTFIVILPKFEGQP